MKGESTGDGRDPKFGSEWEWGEVEQGERAIVDDGDQPVIL